MPLRMQWAPMRVRPLDQTPKRELQEVGEKVVPAREPDRVLESVCSRHWLWQDIVFVELGYEKREYVVELTH